MRQSTPGPVDAYDNGSSPDPLTTSINEQQSFINSSPSKRRPTSSVRSTRSERKPAWSDARATSPMPHTNVSFHQLSPSKSVTEQTLSPWRIKVTVEAEPELETSDERLQTITTTTKIPLREESSILPIHVSDVHSQTEQSSKRTTGRVRRSSTPKGSKGHKKRNSVTNLDIVVLGDDADEDEWGKKNTKSSPRKTRSQKSGSKDRTKQQGISDIQIDESLEAGGIADQQGCGSEDDTPELRQIDLNRVSVRSRSNSTRQAHVADLDMESPLPSTEDVSGVSKAANVDNARKVSVNSTRSYPTPSPTPSEPEYRSRYGTVEVTTDNEPNGHAEGFDTIIESEGFTMIDIDSIPSVKQLRSSPTDSLQHQEPAVMPEASAGRQDRAVVPNNSRPTPARPFPSYLHLADGESDISSAMPSSPPVSVSRFKRDAPKGAFSQLQIPSSVSRLQQRHVTPQTYSSPRLPSPPRAPAPIDRSTPDSVEALRAGKALQGAIEPPSHIKYPTLKQQPSGSGTALRDVTQAKANPDVLFGGFDSDTQHELRAGLRFGEELAKRQQIPYPSIPPEVSRRIQPQVWRGEHGVQRTPPPLQTHNVPRTVKNAPDQLQSAIHLSAQPKPGITDLDSPVIGSASGAFGKRADTTRDERGVVDTRWQQERDDVIEQARRAPAAQTVVLSSDDDDSATSEVMADEENDGNVDTTMNDDIWLAEAKESSSSPQQGVTDIVRPSQQRDMVGNESSVMTHQEGDTSLSGLFWTMPDKDVKFGAGQLRNTRNQLRQSGVSAIEGTSESGVFNIEQMLETPQRLRERVTTNNGIDSNDASVKETVVDEETDSSVEDSIEDISYTSEDEESSMTPQQQTFLGRYGEGIRSEAETPPMKTRQSLSPSKQRPPTPRSALKGNRQSTSIGAGVVSTDNSETETSEQAARRVVWARRSSYMNEDWVESSRSIIGDNSSSILHLDDVVVDESKHDRWEQIQQQENHREKAQGGKESTDVVSHKPQETVVQSRSGWFGWLGRGSEAKTSSEPLGQPKSVQLPSSTPQQEKHYDEELDTSASADQSNLEANSDIWITTSRQRQVQHDSSPFGSEVSSPTVPVQQQPKQIVNNSSRSHTEPQSNPKSEGRQRGSKEKQQQKRKPSSKRPLPSYLKSPSYPSDPTRSVTTPLSTSGEFTNTHFRTLHIIYAKSQRARFHAPDFGQCRPEIRSLVQQKWKLYIDEEDHGMGGFEFRIGETEARVLERFAQEIEFGHLLSLSFSFSSSLVTNITKPNDNSNSQHDHDHDHDHDHETEQKQEDWWCPETEKTKGIWSGHVTHGTGPVPWQWTCPQLATWLGRIVVGEIVRVEEKSL